MWKHHGGENIMILKLHRFSYSFIQLDTEHYQNIIKSY